MVLLLNTFDCTVHQLAEAASVYSAYDTVAASLALQFLRTRLQAKQASPAYSSQADLPAIGSTAMRRMSIASRRSSLAHPSPRGSMSSAQLSTQLEQSRTLRRLSSTGSTMSNRYCRASYSSQAEMQACRRASISSVGTGPVPSACAPTSSLQVLLEDQETAVVA